MHYLLRIIQQCCFSDQETVEENVSIQIHDRTETRGLAQHSGCSDHDCTHDLDTRQIFPLQRAKQQT